MSHNYTGWETKEMKDFKIPLKDLMAHEEAVDELDYEIIDGRINIYSWGNCVIIGTVDAGIITFENFEFSGEGSGHVFDRIVQPTLVNSTGSYKALVVWEGCEVMYFTVDDGVVFWDNV